MIALLLAAGLSLQAAALHEMDRAAADSILAGPAWRDASLEERLHSLALMRNGTPYELGCLGEEKDPDRDPIFRLDKADCTVLVLTGAALIHSTSLKDAEEAIVSIHYREGRPDYSNRYHFTTDRIFFSPWFEGITEEVAADSQITTISMTLNRKADGERLLDIDWERKVTVGYLPAADLTAEILARLPAACGVAFVNEKNRENGYLVSHEGIVLDGETLHHASSAEGMAVSVDLLEYLRGTGERPRFDGVIFYRFL